MVTVDNSAPVNQQSSEAHNHTKLKTGVRRVRRPSNIHKIPLDTKFQPDCGGNRYRAAYVAREAENKPPRPSTRIETHLMEI